MGKLRGNSSGSDADARCIRTECSQRLSRLWCSAVITDQRSYNIKKLLQTVQAQSNLWVGHSYVKLWFTVYGHL